MKPTMSTLFIGINTLNVLDKAITWVALKNPDNFEVNPLVRSLIGKFGLTIAMILYSFLGFILIYVFYKIVVSKRLTCEKNNMPPETLFLMFNVVFCLIVANNIFWAFQE